MIYDDFRVSNVKKCNFKLLHLTQLLTFPAHFHEERSSRSFQVLATFPPSAGTGTKMSSGKHGQLFNIFNIYIYIYIHVKLFLDAFFSDE